MSRFKGIIAIIKKEFARFFLDRRMVLTTVILPGLLIYVVYTIMGSFVSGIAGTGDYTAAVRNMPASLSPVFSQIESFEITEATEDDDYYKTQVREGGLDIYVVFPEDFDEVIAGAVGGAAPSQTPNVEIYYSSSEDGSSAAYSAFLAVLDTFEDSLTNIFDVNAPGGEYDLSTTSMTNYILSAFVPMVLLVLLFSGCMSVAPESIAGEKERGTIATLLVTPIRRSELVIGKICSLSVLSALSAISSFIGTFLAMPKLMGGNIGDMFAAYTAGDYLALFAVMLSAVLLIVCIISILSAYAKSVKEATAFAMPVMVIVMLLGLSSMIFGTVKNPAAFLIPAYNCVQMMSQIFSRALSPVCLVITLASNAVYIGLLVFALTKMFKSEKCMFNN